MNICDTELAVMVEQANAVVSKAAESVGYHGWMTHQLSMITDISAVFKIDVEPDTLNAVVHTTNNIGITKYRLATRILWLLCSGQMAVWNGGLFKKVTKQRTNALGLVYIKLCKAVKLGKLGVHEITSDKGIRILEAEFKRQLKKPCPGQWDEAFMRL